MGHSPLTLAAFAQPLVLSWVILSLSTLPLPRPGNGDTSSLPVFILRVFFIPASLFYQDLFLTLFFSVSFVLTLLQNLCKSFFSFSRHLAAL